MGFTAMYTNAIMSCCYVTQIPLSFFLWKLFIYKHVLSICYSYILTTPKFLSALQCTEVVNFTRWYWIYDVTRGTL